MPTWIVEYGGYATVDKRGTNPMIPREPALAVTQLSSGGSSGTPQTIQFSSATKLVMIHGTVNFYGAFGSSVFSSTSGSTISSTGAVPFLGGLAPQFRGVLPSSKLIGFST